MHALIASALFLAATSVSATAAKMPAQADHEAPAVPGMGLSSGHLAKPVTLRLASTLTPEVEVIGRQSGKPSGMMTSAPVDAVSEYSLSVARRFFQEAKWGSGKAPGKGRELVVKSIKVLAQPGPLYEVQVDVERYENGKRVGQSTGTGMTSPDRAGARRGAGMIGGWAGAAVRNDVNQAKASKDGAAITQATLQALERAVFNASAFWAGEQMAADARKSR